MPSVVKPIDESFETYSGSNRQQNYVRGHVAPQCGEIDGVRRDQFRIGERARVLDLGVPSIARRRRIIFDDCRGLHWCGWTRLEPAGSHGWRLETFPARICAGFPRLRDLLVRILVRT